MSLVGKPYSVGANPPPRLDTMYAATGLVRSIPALQCKSTGLTIWSKAARTLSSKTLPWLDRKLFGLSTIGMVQKSNPLDP